MIALSKSDLDLAAIGLTENPNDILRMGETLADRDLFTASELATFIRFPDNRNVSLIALSKALRRVGFTMRIILTVDGTKRLWAVRNPAKWINASDQDWAKHYADKKFNADKFKG